MSTIRSLERVRRWLAVATERGCACAVDADQAKKIALTNSCSILIAMLNVLFTAVLAAVGAWFLAAVVAAGGVFYALVPVAHGWGPPYRIRYLIPIVHGTAVFLVGSALGPSAMVEFFVFSGSAVAYVQWTSRERLGRVMTLAFPVFVLSGLALNLGSVVPQLATSADVATVLRVTGTIGALILTAGPLTMLFRADVAAERELTETRDRLQAQEALRVELEQSLRRLHAMNRVRSLSLALAQGLADPLTRALSATDDVQRLLESTFPRTLDDQADLDDAADALESTRHGLGRMQTVVGSMQRQARSPTKSDEAGDLNQRVRAAVEGSRALWEGRCVPLLELHTLPPVRGDLHAIGEAVLQLVSNAAAAVGDSSHVGTKTIVVKTNADPAGTVCVSVSDTGPGIAPDVQPRVFEPFFTTRPVGSGMGTGLSLVHNVAQEQGGAVWFETAPSGTTFFLSLPQAGA